MCREDAAVFVGDLHDLVRFVQRGNGGGLAGALGGMGGQSAFGTKAGDVFTRVTIVVAAIWILLCAAAVKMFKPESLENQIAGTNAAPAVGAADASTQPTPTGTPAAAAAPAASTAPAATPTATAPAASPTGTGS
ncbi:MAG: preprotein translocase subunit SecG [Pirellulales bacterium]